MGINHCGIEIFVSQELLDRSDIGSVFQQVSGEAVPEAVTTGPFIDAGSPHGPANGFLHGRLMDVMAANLRRCFTIAALLAVTHDDSVGPRIAAEF